MSMKIGIVGLPNVGKSTLFKALTKQNIDIANYPFCTINPNVGVVPVPDERLEKLSALSRSKKTVPTVVEFVDIAGLVKGAAEGQGLGNAFLTHVREVDAIAEVVRIFEDKDIIHVSEKVDPVSDIEIIEYELLLKDLETVNKRLATAERDARGHKKGTAEELLILHTFQKKLKEGKPTAAIITEEKFEKEQEGRFIKELQLITAKPIIYVFNVSERHIQEQWGPSGALREKIGSAPYAVISAKIEAELVELSPEDCQSFLRSIGVQEGGLHRLITIGYQTLGLVTFFTTGEDESRAWTIPCNATAPRAGRAIHSDFEEKFIRAEVIQWNALLQSGSWAKAREQGLLRIEGKEYVVQDGDVIEFRI